MAQNMEGKNKHLTMANREEIQECLNHGMTFKAISKRIGKDQTTISKEVKKHITLETRSGSSAQETLCPMLRKAPFVCNPCQQRRYCRKTRHLYVASRAHKDYLNLLSESREGIPLSKEQFYANDKIITDGVKRGQHLYHILQTNEMNVSKSTVYRHLHKGYLSVAKLDFPRVVKFKPRKCYAQPGIPRAIKSNRTYDDFIRHCEENDVRSWVEMDTVIGRIGGKVLLTFDFTMCNFMFGILLEDKTAAEVTKAVDGVKKKLIAHGLTFGALFPVVLTDNGGEFANVAALENSPEGTAETKLFFCDPYQSSQKPHVEKNHTLLRDILPSGHSFDGLTQDMVNVIFSHVNSVARKGLNGKTSHEVFAFTFGTTVADTLGIRPISAADVVQSPRLLEQLK